MLETSDKIDYTLIKQDVINYIWNHIGEDFYGNQTGKEFIYYIGLDYNNLRCIMSLDERYKSFSDTEYVWNTFYGRHANKDYWALLHEIDNNIKNRFERSRVILFYKAVSKIEEAIRENHSLKFLLYMLDCSNQDGLYIVVKNEMKKQPIVIKDINRKAHDQLVLKEEMLRKMKFNFFGKRNRLFNDFLDMTDSFLYQRYEIYRSKSLNDLYLDLLNWFEIRNVSRPVGKCDLQTVNVLNEMNIMKLFKEHLFKTLCMNDFFTSELLEEIIVRRGN